MAKKSRRLTEARRTALRRVEDVSQRLGELEELTRANRRELELQFRRIADMQVEIDRLKKPKREA